MRKAVAVSFLLLANMIILAHAVVAHHHHNRAVICIADHCAADNHDNHDHAACSHGQGEEPHDHTGDPTNEKCSLYDVYTRSDNETLKITKPANCDYGQTLWFVPLGASNTSGLAEEIGLPFRQRPFLITYHSIAASHFFGMRAPPVC